MTFAPILPEPEALELLGRGELEIEGRLADASNTTLRCVITYEGVTARCVYKPIRGERPLWDFPDGTLAGRELSAYLVGAATGWSPVPPTVLRDAGPLGAGMCQLWIDDEAISEEQILGFVPTTAVPRRWRRIARAEDEDGNAYVLAHADDERLARLAAFDAVINNGDRKGGHIINTIDGRLYGVDHGVCFNVDNKLRTILWGWTGEPLTGEIIDVLGKLRAEMCGSLGDAIAEHLTISEIDEINMRIDRLLASGRFPAPPDDWPAVPWPPV
jgi:uncharacterized repeat protein (TIGR03843 family)